MEDALMNFILVIAIIIGLALLVIFIRQRFYANKPAEPLEETDLLGNPISRAQPEEAHEPDETTVPIYKLSNIAEAETLKALLEDNGIDCLVHSFHDTAYDGIWQAQKGWGILKVMAKDQAKAERLIDEFLKARAESPEELLESTPIPADKPAFPGIIFLASIIILLGVLAFIIVGIFSAYRNSGREFAKHGYYYMTNNQPDQAIAYYNKAISRWYRESWVYNNRGYAWYKKGDLNNAIKDYNKAIELDPQNDLAYGNRGCAKYDKGDYIGTLMDFERGIEINPRNALAWHNKGAALIKNGRYEEALKICDKAIELDSKNAGAWYNRACAYSLKKDKPNAFEDLKKAISLDTKWKTEAKNDESFKWLSDDAEFKKLTE